MLAAAERISPYIPAPTPVSSAPVGGMRLWFKCENRMFGGSFKLRGATNRLAQLSPPERQSGVVAFSSGNHAQGVAIAARRMGIRATIVMPSDAPAIKVEGTRKQGAEIVFYDRRSESREAIAQRLADERGAVVVPSFDDPAIVAGQGTVGLEISEQLRGTGNSGVKCIIVPCGGGGLAAGIALACPDAEIVIVEPEGWDDMRRSLEGGAIVPVGSNPPPTLCDALQTPRVSPITFAILKERGASAIAVSEAEVRSAVRFAWRELGASVVEPGGAVGLAAALSGKVPLGETTAIVLSGGNIDPALHAQIVGNH